MISADFGTTGQRVAENFSTAQPRVLQALLTTMDAQMLSLESYIRATKLEGDPLHHRSGELESSVNAGKSVIEGDSVIGTVTGGGGLAPYGIVHEYGGVFTVHEYTRRMAFNSSGGKIKLLTKRGLVSTRKAISFVRTDIVVSEHDVEYPERSFMRAGFEEKQASILSALQEAAARALIGDDSGAGNT